MKLPSLLELLKAGVHFGHQSFRWHPKMAPFIHGVRNGVHVINLEKTVTALEKASAVVERVTAKGGIVLFVGTKQQAQDIVATRAQEAGMPYVNVRWLGGSLTNFSQIQKLCRRLLDLRDKREKGELKKYTKLEQLQFDREIEELDGRVGGLTTLTRLPDLIFILDARHDKTVVKEAITMKIPIIALVDSNVNPVGIEFIIPGNDDAVSSIDLIAGQIVAAVKTGQSQAQADALAADKVRKAIDEEVKVAEQAAAPAIEAPPVVPEILPQISAEL